MGRSLMKNAYNLNVLPQLQEAIEELGFKAADIFDMEPDAGLGNGGLGRLAACYLDSMTTLEIPATQIAVDLGNRMAANMVVLGFLSEALDLMSRDDLISVLESTVNPRFLELNIKAVDAGIAYAVDHDLYYRV